MSIKFSYPTAASPTTEIVLGNIEQFPFSRPIRRLQSAYDTAAGNTVVYDWGDTVRTFTVQLFPLTQAQVASLEAFFDSTVNGRALTWQYTDSRGSLYSVRFAQDQFEAVERSYNNATAAFTLREI